MKTGPRRKMRGNMAMGELVRNNGRQLVMEFKDSVQNVINVLILEYQFYSKRYYIIQPKISLQEGSLLQLRNLLNCLYIIYFLYESFRVFTLSTQQINKQIHLLSYYSQFKSKYQSTMQAGDNWLPLESNPQVMNEFIKKLGFKIDEFSVQQLFSLEEWAQDMLLKPVLGIVFLYEINEKQKAFFKQQAKNLENNKVSPNLFYMKQYASNACGTIALFHVIMNAIKDHPHLVQENSYLQKFYQQTKGKTPEQIGQIFKKNKDIKATHVESVKKGQTKVQQKVQTHFIAFIQKDGFLYEMDGAKKQPINHGQTTQESLVMMASLVIQQFMARDPQNSKFTLLAISRTPF